MPLGASALPPTGYVAFCERKPQDCGADTGLVLASARRAEADRAELMAALGSDMPTVVMPAALGARTPATAQPLAPMPDPEVAVLQRADVVTRVDFIDPAAEPRHVRPALSTQMTPRLWSLLNRVNGAVNGAIEQRTDLANYGVDDFWNTPLEDGRRAGDCEDFVLEKQRALIAEGVPREALNIALVVTRWGENHAVLLVSTSEGEYVLDNLSPWVVTWRQAPYRWLRRQVNGDAFNWVMIQADHPHPAPAKGLLIASTQ